jgi:limonene-1,2-epoxide hydrolase
VLTNEEIVLRFCMAFAARMDADELIDYFSDDALYHNIPLPPLRGRAEIYASLKGLPTRFKGIEVEVLNQIASGNLVMNERVDYFQLQDRRVALPIAGVFELENGKIKSRREYFDLATFQNG